MYLIAVSGGSGGILKLIFASTVWAEIVGVLVAWLKVRRRREWLDRPREVGGIELLARYVGLVTAMMFAWALVIVVVALLSSVAS